MRELQRFVKQQLERFKQCQPMDIYISFMPVLAYGYESRTMIKRIDFKCSVGEGVSHVNLDGLKLLPSSG